MLHLQPEDKEIQYPTSDGEPMGETALHRQMMTDLIEALRIHYQGEPEVYVSGNLLMLYEEGKPNSHVSPDVFIALGVPQGERDNYKVWEEGKAPDLVIEITSKSTRIRDIGFKKGLYEVLGVVDYLIFDPRHEYLKPSFQAYRLEGDSFLRVLVGENCAYTSASTGLEFRIVNGVLRIFSATGEMLLTPSEYATRAREQAAIAEQEKARAEQEKARAEHLQKELNELKKRMS